MWITSVGISDRQFKLLVFYDISRILLNYSTFALRLMDNLWQFVINNVFSNQSTQLKYKCCFAHYAGRNSGILAYTEEARVSNSLWLILLRIFVAPQSELCLISYEKIFRLIIWNETLYYILLAPLWELNKRTLA